jgi:hypothetical protein
MASSDSRQFQSELNRLKQAGFTGPAHPYRAAQSYASGINTMQDMSKWAEKDLTSLSYKLGRTVRSDDLDNPELRRIKAETNAMVSAMGNKRAAGGMGRTGSVRREAQDSRWDGMQRTSMVGGGGSAMGGDVMNAIPRFYDPLEYWDLSGLPWNVADEGHRHKLHKWLRLYYATHYLVPILVDIFTRFPLVGLELEHEDPDLVEIYSEMFLNQLQYEDFLVSLGREVWLVGEAFPLGSFVDTLGIWEHESLINPEDVVIDNFPLLDSQQLKIVPPDYLRRIAQTKTPPREWYQLQQNYGDLLPYLLKGEHIPMSPVVMRQVSNKMNDWDDHGTPILLRGLRTLLHEEKLMASQDAIAERLYSPFILAKLGAMDMGDGLPPWIPTPEELEQVRDDIDVAMASDFRVMVHHFALDMSSVFGREQMPRLGDDFDRIERRLMQVFGVNPSLLSAGSNSQPYASSALQAEFMNQILRTFQKQLKEHFKQRAMVVAEAQGHYAYERKGQSRIPIWETVMEPDDEGELRPVRKQKLTCPDMTFATFDLRDEATERQFMQQLRLQGVPIPDDKLMIGVSWKDKDYVEEYNRDIMYKTIQQQQAKMDTYIALVIKGLPVPADLKMEVESVLAGNTGPAAPPQGGPPGGGGPGGGGPPPEGGPPPGGPGGGGGMMMPPPPDMGGAPPGGGAPATDPNEAGPRGNVPEASNERREGLKYNAGFEGKVGNLDDLANMTRGWPEDMRRRATQIFANPDSVSVPQVVHEGAATISETETEEETSDPTTWELGHNQKADEQDGKSIILEGSNRLFVPAEPGKRYALIDPLAEPLDELEETDEDLEGKDEPIENKSEDAKSA